MSMPAPQRISGEAFAVERLRENPDLDYAALRRLAGEAGVTIQPIQYGRARKQLGLPPMQRPSRAIVLSPQGEAPAAAKSAPFATASAGRDEADADADETATDMVAPRRRGSEAFDFLVHALRRDGSLSYADLRAQCEQKGWKIAPIMYGRAKAMLGLVPVKPRGPRKAKAEAAAAAVVADAAPRTLRQVESVAADRFHQQLEDVRNVEQLVAVVKNLDAERRRLRALLEEIAVKIDEALG